MPAAASIVRLVRFSHWILALTEVVPLALTNWVVGPDGVTATVDSALPPECPMSYELLRSSAM